MPNLERLRELVEDFRSYIEKNYDWKEHPGCFGGICGDISAELYAELIDAGFQAEWMHGGVTGAGFAYWLYGYVQWTDEQKEEFELDHLLDYQSMESTMFTHWWIEVEIGPQRYVVDVTFDQFRPGEEEQYRVILKPVEEATNYHPD